MGIIMLVRFYDYINKYNRYKMMCGFVLKTLFVRET